MLEEIMRLAQAMSGEESVLLEPLCRAALEELTAELREGLTAEDCGSAFPCAAACLAAAALAETRPGGGVASFRAGDVSVTTSEASGNQLRALAKRLMAPYSRSGFCFQGVRT